MIESGWRALASQRTTAILVIALSIFVALMAFIPQGREALELAEHPGAVWIHRLASLGLTDVFASAWMRALGVLLAANLIATAIAAALGEAARAPEAMPRAAKCRAELTASLPERAIESLRASFRAMLGAPASEEVRGSRVTMVFDTSPRGRFAPMSVHLGLITLVAGAGLSAQPVPENRTVVRAQLEVKDTASGFVGRFDMVSGEPFTFFRWPAKYTIRGYVPSKDGLGPALRIERREADERRVEEFWVFLHAPAGFDERHRKAEVAITAKKMALVPMPGAGITSSPSSLLLILGVGLLLSGLIGSRRPEGRVWLEADGDRVTITGVPNTRGDRGFESSFERWVRVASVVLAEP